jgi:hypothetical protein
MLRNFVHLAFVMRGESQSVGDVTEAANAEGRFLDERPICTAVRDHPGRGARGLIQ